MIYKKIENFIADFLDSDIFVVPLPQIVFLALTSPLWFPIWLISKFYNTPKE